MRGPSLLGTRSHLHGVTFLLFAGHASGRGLHSSAVAATYSESRGASSLRLGDHGPLQARGRGEGPSSSSWLCWGLPLLEPQFPSVNEAVIKMIHGGGVCYCRACGGGPSCGYTYDLRPPLRGTREGAARCEPWESVPSSLGRATQSHLHPLQAWMASGAGRAGQGLPAGRRPASRVAY